jgi:hypothetical protein
MEQKLLPEHRNVAGWQPFWQHTDTYLFVQHPDNPEGEARDALTLKLPADFSDEDIKRIRISYKKLMEDKTHAM